MNDKKELFESMPVPKALMTVALPTIVSQLINLIYNLADTFYVGRTGDPYMIAAISLCSTLFIMTVSIANLFGIGGGGKVSRLMGVGEYNNAKSVSSFSFWGAIIGAAVYSILILAFMNPLLRFLGASDSTIEYARQYTIVVVVIGTIPVVLSQTMAHLLRNTGYAKQASFGLSGGGVMNIILDPLFMFVIFPHGMEVFAAALATTLSNVLSMIYFYIMIRKVSASAPLSVSPSDMKKCTKENRREVIVVGIPSALLPGLYDIGNMVLNIKMAAHGDIQLAAIGIVLKIERLPNAIGIGISQGMLPLVAYNYASGNRKRREEIISFARLSGIIVTAATIILYEIFARPISSVFISTAVNSEAELVLGYAAAFLKVRAVSSIVMFLNYHTSYCMQSMGDGKGTLIHSICRQLVFYIPIMFLFDFLWGETGLTWALFAGESLGAITALLLLNSWTKKTERHLKRG